MPTQIKPQTVETLVLVFVSAGAGSDGGGWGITPSGKLKKIPSNNPVGKRVIAAAQAAALPVAGSAALGEIARLGLAEMASAAQELAASWK